MSHGAAGACGDGFYEGVGEEFRGTPRAIFLHPGAGSKGSADLPERKD
jgi:hypothetical protein